MRWNLVGITLGLIAASVINVDPGLAEDKRYLNLGEDHQGNLFHLDTEKITGTTYTLYTLSNDTIFEMTYNASCSESRLFQVRINTYTTSGSLLKEDKEQTEVPFNPQVPSGKGMTFVCRKLSAMGW
jgi:hypothetical protein